MKEREETMNIGKKGRGSERKREETINIGEKGMGGGGG